MNDMLIERAVNVIIKYGFKSWNVYTFEVARWYFRWNTTEVYEIWKAVVDDSHASYELIEKIQERVKERLWRQLNDVVDKYGIILDHIRLGVLLEKSIEEREGISKLNC